MIMKNCSKRADNEWARGRHRYVPRKSFLNSKKDLQESIIHKLCFLDFFVSECDIR